jgi:phosphatidyl-myo-inositol dimannoside synthase
MPELHDANPGGIQVSGEIAWEALRQHADARLLEVDSRRRMSALRAARRTRFDCDVVLFWHLDLLKLAPLLRATGRRVVYLHGIESWRRPGFLTRPLLRDCVFLANSRYTAVRAGACMPHVRAEEVGIVPLGLGDPMSAHAAPADVPSVVIIGRLDSGERYKGHHEVISAWPLVRARIRDAQLWIVGEGGMRAELEALAAAHRMDDAIRFFGRVGESEKQQLIQSARALVLPSRGEGFGLVYLEAMRAGRPCVVGVDAGPEVVQPPDAGISVDPNNTASLVDAIVTLLTPGEAWQQWSAAARRRYETQYTAHHFQERLLSALRAVR